MIYEWLLENKEIITLICNIFIAIGTVGAIIISLYFSFKSNKKNRKLYIVANIRYIENNLNQINMTVSIENQGNITIIIPKIPEFLGTESNNQVPILIPSSEICNIEYTLNNNTMDEDTLLENIINIVTEYHLLDSFNNFYYPERFLVNGRVYKYRRPKKTEINLFRKMLSYIKIK